MLRGVAHRVTRVGHVHRPFNVVFMPLPLLATLSRVGHAAGLELVAPVPGVEHLRTGRVGDSLSEHHALLDASSLLQLSSQRQRPQAPAKRGKLVHPGLPCRRWWAPRR